MTFAERFDDERVALDAGDNAETEGEVADAILDLGTDERRMHVRAYNHWVSLLHERPYPAIADLDPASIVDFGPHSVLLDFSAGVEDPTIAYLGRALREECELAPDIARVADVPSRSLLSRLTDHYLQIIANRAPIGFEAEFISQRGRTTLYRGILMPFSSDGDAIDFIYGVINWKEVADAATQASLGAELDAAMRQGTAPVAASQPVWADGPSADQTSAEEASADKNMTAAPTDTSVWTEALGGTLGDQLMMARESAAAVRAADTRSRSALYRALGRAHDFALAADADPSGYDAMLVDARITVQTRAPMTPVVKLVFGADYDKTRLAEYAGVLAHARRHRVGAGGLAGFLDGVDGGIKAVVAAERAARRPVARAAPGAITRLRDAPALATVDLAHDGAEFVVLVARARADGGLDIVSQVTAQTVIDAAIKRAVA